MTSRRGRGRSNKLESNISLRLPQELIDAIIDEFDASIADARDSSVFSDRMALKACSLVSRAFVPASQMKLFSEIDLYGEGRCSGPPDTRIRAFSKLLSSKPHIRPYIKTLYLTYPCARSNSVDHILTSLPQLKTLSLFPWPQSSVEDHWDYLDYGNPPLPSFPIHHRDSLLAAFSLSSLRRLEFRNHRFEDIFELETILGNSTGLKELTLRSFQFIRVPPQPQPQPQPIHPAAPRVVLVALEILGVEIKDVDAMVDSFTIVDITHLRSLCSDRYHVSLLKANSHSLHELTLVVNGTHLVVNSGNVLLSPARLDDIISGHNLHILNLRMLNQLAFPRIFFNTLGYFANLRSLERVSITARGTMDPGALGYWARVDSMLGDTGLQLKSVNVNLDYGDPGILMRAVEEKLPILKASGILTVSIMPAAIITKELRYE
ncbi:hypothetical protein DFH06DRAFT_1467803 [Mycena polygramma]|nr:hypothetical protein DFH06DRAFT_1468160 [Mycena polygramma]KAJ7672297.1 hypothetical protein DFH06DRAFT_1467803 [Mycena polygramma]